MSSLIQNMLIVVGLLIVLALGAYLWFEQSGQTLSMQFDAAPATVTSVQSQQFLDQFQQLEAVSFNAEAVFGNDHFQALTNFSRPVVDQPVGRDNPFAPVGQ